MVLLRVIQGGELLRSLTQPHLPYFSEILVITLEKIERLYKPIDDEIVDYKLTFRMFYFLYSSCLISVFFV